jgi:hypothetical protein
MRPPRKSPGSWQDQLCPSPEEIREFKYGHLDPVRRAVVGRHLRHCRICEQIYRAPYLLHKDEPVLPARPDRKAAIEKLYRHPQKRFSSPADPLHLAAGQVWTVAPPPPGTTLTTGERLYMGTPVVIVDPGNKQRQDDNEIRCMPVSEDTDFHQPAESVLIEKADSPLGYAVLAEVFNERPMLARDLRRYQGDLSPEIMLKLNRVRGQLWSNDQTQQSPSSPEYRQWKRLEIEMAAYLSASVNEALWADEDDEGAGAPRDDFEDNSSPDNELYVTDQGVVVVSVWLQPVRLAAETEGIELKEIHPTRFWQDERLAAGIVQTRDRVYLKVVWIQGVAGRVMVDGRPLAPCAGDAGEQYFDLGTVGNIPGALSVEIQLEADVIRILVSVKEKPAEE